MIRKQYTCKSVGVWLLRAPPKVPNGVLFAATTKMPCFNALPIAIFNLVLFTRSCYV